MSFFRFTRKINPLVALVAAVAFVVVGLITAKARTVQCSIFLLSAYVWLLIFGFKRGCVNIILPFIIVGGIFGTIAYFVYGNDYISAIAMVNRFGAVFLAVAIGMSIEPVDTVRTLSSLKVPRQITLGILIATSFPSMLGMEIKRVREAMKTRGAGSVLNPKVFYRAFLVPFVMRLVSISDTLSLSVETRGFTLEKSSCTVYKKVGVTICDVLFVIGVIASAVMVIVL